jgi:hypothetical protein
VTGPGSTLRQVETVTLAVTDSAADAALGYAGRRPFDPRHFFFLRASNLKNVIWVYDKQTRSAIAGRCVCSAIECSIHSILSSSSYKKSSVNSALFASKDGEIDNCVVPNRGVQEERSMRLNVKLFLVKRMNFMGSVLSSYRELQEYG